MHKLRPLLGCLGIAVAGLAASGPATAQQVATSHPVDYPAVTPTGYGSDVDSDVARVRAATAAFRSLDSAVAAGYARDVKVCVDHPEHGGMGYHHVNRALLDDRIDVERPEILVYARLPNGEYKLNGVEYIVPYAVRPPDQEPPTVMGQELIRADRLKLWFRHVWIWEENPSGLFASWNPNVKC